MKYQCATLLALLWLAAASAAHAQVTPLSPVQTLTVRFDHARLLERGTPPALLQTVSAQADISLDETGTVVTIRLQNTSAPASGAALYALDLGLPLRLVNETKMTASFSGFPAGGTWMGPTDKAAPTGALGFSTFAARAVVLGRVEDFLPARSSLTGGFLQAGQQGVITLTLALSLLDREKPLRLEPRLYFLAPDPRTSQKRVQLVVTGVARIKP